MRGYWEYGPMRKELADHAGRGSEEMAKEKERGFGDVEVARNAGRVILVDLRDKPIQGKAEQKAIFAVAAEAEGDTNAQQAARKKLGEAQATICNTSKLIVERLIIGQIQLGPSYRQSNKKTVPLI